VFVQTSEPPTPDDGDIWLDTDAPNLNNVLWPWRTTAIDYTALTTDVAIDCSAALTITLPAAAAAIQGKPYYIKRTGSGLVTIAADGSDLIDGESSQPLVMLYENLFIICTGTSWGIR